jgi:monofunctional glycosyltransferase
VVRRIVTSGDAPTPEEIRRRFARGESGPKRRRPARWRRVARAVVLLPFAWYLLCVVGFVYLRFLPPLITGVQLQRTVEQLARGERPVLDYRWRSTDRVSRHLPRAVVAAEDARFYRHRGFDWEELRRARERARARGEAMRGASTLTQQLIKNLYFTTHRNPVRKAYEWALTPPAELILGKDRIVALYVNVVEFGPGIYGAEAAARHHYGSSAAGPSRHQAASLAAILPAPLRRRPQNMGAYAGIIQQRMSQMGW